MAQIQCSLTKEIKIGCPEHSLTPPPQRQITSHFRLIHPTPPPSPLKVDVICASTIYVRKKKHQIKGTKDTVGTKLYC